MTVIFVNQGTAVGYGSHLEQAHSHFGGHFRGISSVRVDGQRAGGRLQHQVVLLAIRGLTANADELGLIYGPPVGKKRILVEPEI